MNVLQEIILYKKIEVAERKKEWSVSQLEESDLFEVPVRSLKAALDLPNATGIIAEYKRRSPSKGMLNESASVEEVTQDYAANGASALSVLTDEKFFGGFVPDLLKARKTELPILRKDFIIDEYQLIATKSFGADAVLLIAACHSVKRIAELAAAAKKLGLETILEVHEEKELGHLCDDIDFIGVNNRDLRSFETNINTSLSMMEKLPTGFPAIAESGINSMDTVRSLRTVGYKGFLIGERFMKESDPGLALKNFLEG